MWLLTCLIGLNEKRAKGEKANSSNRRNPFIHRRQSPPSVAHFCSVLYNSCPSPSVSPFHFFAVGDRYGKSRQTTTRRESWVSNLSALKLADFLLTLLFPSLSSSYILGFFIFSFLISQMPESKDPAIKLFGKTIALPDISASGCGGASDSPPPLAISSPPVHDGGGSGRGDKEQPNISSLTEDDKSDKDGEERENHKGQSEGDSRERKEEEIQTSLQFLDKPTDSDRVTGVTEESKALSSVNDRVVSKTEEGNYGTSISLEKTAKKPDKILPCPRCNSMDTKFCYFNNYNVNQPRHFCKNCQRYWTAGGAMRNVPVGAGRRKNKNSSSQYPHMTAPEVMHTAPRDLPNGLHHSAQRTNGTVLSFGSDMPLCESMTSILNIAENTMRNSSQNGLQNPGELKIAIPIGIEKASGHMNASDSNNDLNKAGLDDSATQDCHVFSPQIACFPGAPWPFAWNSGQWSPQVAAPALCPNGFPMPFYPAAAAYWGCSVPGTWNVPWVTQPFPLNPATSSSGPNSPLGKHSRDGTTLKSGSLGVEQAKESDHDKCLWVPKTLRIDDPGEAAKSSIWTTLGIKNDKVDSIGGGGLFKAFHLKDDEKNHSVEASPTLQANPAALSRSQSFHESS